MIKWDMLLSGDAFYQVIHQYDRFRDKNYKENVKIKAIAEQHRTVITPSLEDMYIDYLTSIGAEDGLNDLENLIDNISSYEEHEYCYLSEKAVKRIDKETMEDHFKRLCNTKILFFPIVLCDSKTQYNELKGKIKEEKLFVFEEILRNKFSNRIRRNCIGFSKDLLPQDYHDFFDWLGEIFRGEKKIDIFDPYLGRDKNLKLFREDYLPRIEEGTIINIYTTIDELKLSNKEVQLFAQATKERKITAYGHEVSSGASLTMHERRIYLYPSKIHITIGHGLDTFNQKDQTMKDCHISIDDDFDWRKRFESDYSSKPFSFNDGLDI